jgi:hypothetical protein
MPSHPGLFKDLNKRASDLLTKEFPSEKQENKVEFKGETAQNVSWETSLVQSKDGSVLGTFIPKYKWRPYGTTFSAELKTTKDFKAEVAVEDQLAPGLKTTLSGESRNNELIGTCGLEYKHELATVTASVDYGSAAGSAVKASAVVGSQGFTLGGMVDYFLGNTVESSVRELHTVAGYYTDEFDVSAFGKLLNEKDQNILGANYFHRVNSDVSVGTEVQFDTANTDTKPKLTFGGQFRLEQDSLIKAKVDTAGKVGLSFQQRFNKNSKLTISGTVDTNNLAGKGASTFGMTLSLS